MTRATRPSARFPVSLAGPLPAILAALLALWAAPAPAPALEVPFLAGRVNDLADMLPAEAEARLEARLERLEDEHGAQVAVLTIPSLEGEVLEDYSLRVAETWQLGRGKVDDGVLLLIARDDRKLRLEVGYGLEPTLTDLASRRILDDVIRPRFRQGDFPGGVEQGVDVIARLIEGEDALPPPGGRDRSGGSPPIGSAFGGIAMLAFFSIVAISARGCFGWLLYLVLIPFWFTLAPALLPPPWALLPGFLWMFGFPITWLLFLRSGLGKKWVSGGSGGWWSSSGGFGGSSGGGFSGGGFSGGGGSFGGGGSSGSW